MADISKEQAVRSDFETWCEIFGYDTSPCGANKYLYWYADTSAAWDAWQAAFKLGRNAGLEEAKQLFPQPYQEYFGREAQDAIESLKDNTP